MKRPDLAEIRKLVDAMTANTTMHEGEECLVIGRKYYYVPKNLTSQEFYKIEEELVEKYDKEEDEFFEKVPKILLDLCSYIEELEKETDIRVAASAFVEFAPDLAEELRKRWKEAKEKT